MFSDINIILDEFQEDSLISMMKLRNLFFKKLKNLLKNIRILSLI